MQDLVNRMPFLRKELSRKTIDVEGWTTVSRAAKVIRLRVCLESLGILHRIMLCNFYGTDALVSCNVNSGREN